jgi:nucleoside-diphosphate-sugar epimerase
MGNRASASSTTTSPSTSTSTAPSTRSSTSPRCRARSTTCEPIPTLKVGALGTHKALGLARAKGARFLLASTSEVYGDPQVHPQPETYWGNVNPVGPRGVYDESKRFAEAMTMAYHRYHGLETRICRIFNTYGPRMRPTTGASSPTSSPRRSAASP